MAEWVFDVANMIPHGEVGERLVIAKLDRLTGTVSVIRTPMLDSTPAGESVSIDDHVFMRSSYSGASGTNEIDAFLQAAMECGWKRGLRPKKFDPSAGELAAVNRHLEDLRKIALQQALHSPALGGLGPLGENRGQEAAAQLSNRSDVGGGEDKSW